MLTRTRGGAVASLCVAIVVGFSSGAVAGEKAMGARLRSSADLVGNRGTQGIRTNPATVNGVGYIHPTQMDVGSQGASFVAIGTANGLGVSNCANDYDPNWTGYYDGEIAGVYFCQDFAQDNWAAGATPSFRIERDCQLGGNVRWGLYFAGSHGHA